MPSDPIHAALREAGRRSWRSNCGVRTGQKTTSSALAAPPNDWALWPETPQASLAMPCRAQSE